MQQLMFIKHCYGSYYPMKDIYNDYVKVSKYFNEVVTHSSKFARKLRNDITCLRTQIADWGGTSLELLHLHLQSLLTLTPHNTTLFTG